MLPKQPSASSPNNLRLTTSSSYLAHNSSARSRPSPGSVASADRSSMVRPRRGSNDEPRQAGEWVEYGAGMLQKLKVGKGWKQRWVTVAAGQSDLEYRKDPGNATPRGAIPLYGSAVVRDVANIDLSGRLFEREAPRDPARCFRLIVEGQGDYVFAAQTVEEREHWVGLLEAKSRGYVPSTALPSVRSQHSPQGAQPRTPGSGASLPRTRGSGGLTTGVTPSMFRDRAVAGANRRLQIYGSLVCFRVQRVLIEWLRSDSETAAVRPSPALQAIRAFGARDTELTRELSRGRSRSGEALAHATHGLRHLSHDLESEQLKRDAAKETEHALLETELVDDIALEAVRSEIHRLSSAASAAGGTPTPQGAVVLPYFAGWLEVRGAGAATAWGAKFRNLGRKGWRMQWCVIAGGFLMAFDQPVNLLTGTVREDLSFCLLGWALMSKGRDASDGSNRLCAELVGEETHHERPDCMVLVDRSDADSSTVAWDDRAQFLINVPRRNGNTDNHLDARLQLPAGDMKTAIQWEAAMCEGIATARRHSSLSYEYSRASALGQVLAENTSLLLQQVDATTGLSSPELAKQVGANKAGGSSWVSLLCGGILSRVMQAMDSDERMEILQGMDAWFNAPRRGDPDKPGGRGGGGGGGGGGGPRGSGSSGSGTNLSSVGSGTTLSSSSSSIVVGCCGSSSRYPHSLPVELAGTLVSHKRQLLQCGLLRCLTGAEQPEQVDMDNVYVAFLFSDILLLAEPHEVGGSSLGQLLDYHWHCPLTECDVGPAAQPHRFCIRHCGSEWMFEVAADDSAAAAAGAGTMDLRKGAALWLASCRTAIDHGRVVHRNECRLERYEGAVLFADISGFSNLGDELERRQEQRGKAAAGVNINIGPRRLAAEELAKIIDAEVDKMVRAVTEGGGDVIQFAGDCVIAVFPAADYTDEYVLPKGSGSTSGAGSSASALSLATVQAANVALKMVESKNEFFRTQLEALDAAAGLTSTGGGGIQQLQDALNIHAAVGSGLIYGYHVGGGAGNKWHYVIDGPAMEQVRIADGVSKASEIILSNEARTIMMSLQERMREKRREAFTKDGKKVATWVLMSYFGTTPAKREHIWPWESLGSHDAAGASGDGGAGLQGLGLRYALADKLRSYIPQPVVDQVDDGQTVWLHSLKTVSTMFVKLFGIDYAADNGEQAVSELGALVHLIQRVLEGVGGGTMTRVSCDDKGTSAILMFYDAGRAVAAAIQILDAVGLLGGGYKSTIGITTGEVWLGVAGGETRAEYTMHGSCVNFAARLMSCKLIKESGGILTDDATRMAVNNAGPDDGYTECVFEPQEPMEFKGFVEKYVSYMPVPIDAAQDSPAVAADAAMRASGGNGGVGRAAVGGGGYQLSHMDIQTLQVCAVLAMASDSHDCGRIFAPSVAAMHPTLDEAACYTELARLATPAAGGLLVPIMWGSHPHSRTEPDLPPHFSYGEDNDGGGGGSAGTAMYSFSSRSEMESRYNELPADAARSLHGLAIDDYEARLQDGSAHDLAGLSYAQSQALVGTDGKEYIPTHPACHARCRILFHREACPQTRCGFWCLCYQVVGRRV